MQARFKTLKCDGSELVMGNCDNGRINVCVYEQFGKLRGDRRLRAGDGACCLDVCVYASSEHSTLVCLDSGS